ncbi:unnamed protein product [Camellia sinensis]
MAKSQNSKFKCFSSILCCGSLPTQPSDPTTNIPTTTTTTTTFENPKKNFKIQVKTPGVVARLMGLDSLPDPRKVFRRKEDQKEESGHKGKDSMVQEECKDEYEVLETSKVERISYPAKRTINSNLPEAEMAFIQQKFMADHDRILSKMGEGTFGVDHRAEKYFKRSARLDWLGGASSKESTRAVLKLPRLQNSQFKCFCCLLCIGSLPTQPSDPTTNIPTTTTTTTFENPKKNFKTHVKTPGVVARLKGLDSLPDPRKVHVDGRPSNVIARMMGLDGLPPQHPLHRQHKGFSETYRQWTAPVSSQRDGKPYEHQSNRKYSMAQQECKDEYEVLETSKVERSSYPAKRTINSNRSEAEMEFIQQKFMADHDRILSKMGEGTFGQVFECLDNGNLEHLAMMERLLGPLPQHMITSADVSPELMGLDGLPPQQPLHRQHKGFSETYRQWTASVSPQRDGKPYEHRSNRKDSMALQECKNEYEVLEISKVERSSYPAKRTINSKLSEAEMAFIQQKFMADHDCRTFGQVLECLDNENFEHLAMMERLFGPLPQHMIIGADLSDEKYFKRSARLDWLEGASSKESTWAIWKLLCLQRKDNENLEHLGMMEKLLGPLPQHIIIGAGLCAEKYFKRSARLDWLEGASSKESTRAVWKLPRLQSQNCKFKCFSGILCCLLCIGSLLSQPSIPTTDIPTTTTTTYENPKRNLKTQVKTPGVLARLMGLDSLPDPRKVFRRKEDQKEKVEFLLHVDGRPPNVIARLIGLDGLPSRQPLHRQHKGFSKTYRQWTASVSSQRDGKPYELRSNRKDSMAQQECKDEYEVLETSKVERSRTFGQVLECLDNENLEHLGMMERLLGPLPQHIIIGAGPRAEKYLKRSARLEWLEGASSKESTRAVWKLPRLQGTFGQVLECLDNENLEHLGMMERLLGPLPQHIIIGVGPRAEKYLKRSARLEWLEGASSKESTRAVWKLPRLQYRILSKMGEGTFGQVLECLDNENLEHLGMMERLLGPLPQHIIIGAGLRAEKYFKRSARLDWLESASSKESTRAVWKLPRLQNCKFKCFSGILCCLLCIGSLLTQPSIPTTNIPTTTTFENPKKNFKTQVKTPGVVARLMGLDSLPDPRKVFMRKEDPKEKIHVDGRPPNVIARLIGLDGLPSQQPLHRQRKGFSKTYRQLNASVSSQRDGKPYELRSNRKDSMAQQECKDEYEVLETSKDRILSKMGEGTFGQVLECLDNENLEHLGMMERLLGPLPQHIIIGAGLRAEKYFKRSARLDWLEDASSKEITRAVWKLPAYR